MKEGNRGITLISLIIRTLIIILIAIIIISIVSKYSEGITEKCTIAYNLVVNKTNIQEELNKNEKLIGITDVSGEGIIIDINDGNDLIHQEDLIILIDELKNAGSQAISINEQRITNSTYIYCDGTVILIDGVKIGNPFKIKAIGNSETIYGALTRNKGYIETLKKDGLKIEVQKNDNIEIFKSNKTTFQKYKNEKNIVEKLYLSNQMTGKSSVMGKGIEILIQENNAKLTALSFLQIINDLNSTDVEAISINGQRITTLTDIVDISGKYVLINSISVNAPYVIDVVGNQDKIEEVLNFNNSYITKIKDKGNIVNINRINFIKIKKYIQMRDQNKMLVNFLNCY